jgi:hypothetical protein
MTHSDIMIEEVVMDLKLLKKSLLKFALFILVFCLLFFPELVVGSLVSTIDCAIVLGVWYFEYWMLRGIVRFVMRGFGWKQNRVSTMNNV